MIKRGRKLNVISQVQNMRTREGKRVDTLTPELDRIRGLSCLSGLLGRVVGPMKGAAKDELFRIRTLSCSGPRESNDISGRGSGDATLRVQESLSTRISGLGPVEYYGSPAVTRRISGSGSIRHLGDR